MSTENILALPALTNELARDMHQAWAHEPASEVSRWQAAITTYLAEAVRWQDIEPEDIKPGMQLRGTRESDGQILQSIFFVARVEDFYIDTGEYKYLKEGSYRWQVDPRTIPDQAILDILAEWISVDDAPSALADLRSVADVTPKAVES